MVSNANCRNRPICFRRTVLKEMAIRWRGPKSMATRSRSEVMFDRSTACRIRSSLSWAAILVAVPFVGCGGDTNTTCSDGDDCTSGEVCRDSECVPSGWNLDGAAPGEVRSDGGGVGTPDIDVVDSVAMDAPKTGRVSTKRLTVDNSTLPRVGRRRGRSSIIDGRSSRDPREALPLSSPP